MPLALDPLLDRLLPLLADEAQPVHIVGGAVRDALLGRPGHDIDLIVPTGATALTERLARRLRLPWFALDESRDVARIFSGDTTLDIARYRGESFAEDLRGRDFTINALALPIAGRNRADVIDHHGGLADLEAGLVRAIHAGSISDDPVRALRAARFVIQLHFNVTAETLAAVRAAGPTLPSRTSPERLRDELSRMLALATPAPAIARLDTWGLLDSVLPEVAALRGLDQSPPHHEAVLPHTLRVLRYLVEVEQVIDGGVVSVAWAEAAGRVLAPYRQRLVAHLDETLDGGVRGRLLLRWAALFHDSGKALTRTVDETGRIRFLGHDEAGAKSTAAALNRLKFSGEAVRRVRDTVDGHMRPLLLATEGRAPSARAVYRYYRALHAAGIDVTLLALADHLATYDGPGHEGSWESLLDVAATLLEHYYEKREQTVMPVRFLNGQAIMQLLGMGPGRELGQLIAQLEEAQAAGEVTSYDEAVIFLRRTRMGQS